MLKIEPSNLFVGCVMRRERILYGAHLTALSGQDLRLSADPHILHELRKIHSLEIIREIGNVEKLAAPLLSTAHSKF
jgi:hypothetical protein